MVRSNRGTCGGLTGGRKAKRGTHNWHKMGNSHKEMLRARKSNKGKHNWHKMANSHKEMLGGRKKYSAPHQEMNGGRRKSKRAGCGTHNGGKSKRVAHQEMKSKRGYGRHHYKSKKGAHKKHYKKSKKGAHNKH